MAINDDLVDARVRLFRLEERVDKLAGLPAPESPIYEHIGWACYTTGNDGNDKMVLCGERTFGAFPIYRRKDAK